MGSAVRQAVSLRIVLVLGGLLLGQWAAASSARADDRVQRSVRVPTAAERVAQDPDAGPQPPPRVPSTRQAAPPAQAPIEVGPIPEYGPHELVEGEMIVPDDFQYQYDYDTDCGLGCQQCGGVGCDLMWMRAEYLLYWVNGMRLPPLATTSPNGTALDDAGVLGLPTTTILYGGTTNHLEDLRQGGQFTIGSWLDTCQNMGLEFDYFFLAEERERFQASGFGDPIIMRPFFNDLDGMEDAQIVSFPDQLGGTLTIDTTSQIQGGGVRLLHKLLENCYCGDDVCGGCGATTTQIHLITGYRFLDMDEQLRINEDLVSLQPNNPGTFDVNDIFDTSNEFHGPEAGLQWRLRRSRMEINLLAKLALGNNRQQVGIRGFTTITEGNNPPETLPGGLLTQTSNIGDYSRDKFSLVSELGSTVRYHMSRRVLLSAGYTVIFWNNVVRPGDQIDLRVNPNLIPPPVAGGGGPNTPAFTFRDTNLWIQGLRLGGEVRF